MVRRILFLLLMFALPLQAAEPIDLTISVTAAPLQAWRAMCVNWQILQWNGAASAFLDVRPDGPWRITHKDGSIEEGIFEAVDRGSRLTYSYIYEDSESRVDITFLATPDGCDIHILHDEFGPGRAADGRRSALLERWETKLPLLSAYLDRVPGSYLKRPERDGTFPAVLLLHDRFGLNRTIRYFADSLANNGYVVLAVDMFKGDVTADIAQAIRYLELVNNEESIQTAHDGFRFLKADKSVNRRRIAVWGFGYGGSMALRLASQVPETRLCVNWYGTDLPGEDQLPRIASRVFGIFASATPAFVPPVAENFNSRLTQAGVRVETVLVLGSDDFADPGYGLTYNSATVTDAWRQTISRLDRLMKL